MAGSKPESTNQRLERLFKAYLEVGKGLIFLANLAAGSLLFNRVLSDKPLRFIEVIIAVVIVLMLYALAFALMTGGEPKE